jgi:phage head maturation protease
VSRIIDTYELRANPALAAELRDHPGDYIERRTVTTTGVEVRDGDTDAGWKGGGLAIVYNTRSENLGGFTEIIKAGAARKLLKTSPDVRALQNHNPDLLLGRTNAGTLRLKDTPKGLDYEFDAPTRRTPTTCGC